MLQCVLQCVGRDKRYRGGCSVAVSVAMCVAVCVALCVAVYVAVRSAVCDIW